MKIIENKSILNSRNIAVFKAFTGREPDLEWTFGNDSEDKTAEERYCDLLKNNYISKTTMELTVHSELN